MPTSPTATAGPGSRRSGSPTSALLCATSPITSPASATGATPSPIPSCPRRARCAAPTTWRSCTTRNRWATVPQSFWIQRGEWTFAAYQIVKKNLLTRDASNPALSVQVGEQSSRGLEASVSVALMRGLRLDANGTVLRARYDDFAESVNGALVSRNGNVPTSVAQQAANLWLTWAFAPRWQAGGGLRYVGKRYTNNANTTTMPSYTVVDASLQWRVSRKTALTLRVYNLFNRDYAESSGNSGGQWLLGRPRAAELSANFYF
nr:TonB-dependent receptor [Cupriavidus basilensis]